jgi:hypothetical protein
MPCPGVSMAIITSLKKLFNVSIPQFFMMYILAEVLLFVGFFLFNDMGGISFLADICVLFIIIIGIGAPIVFFVMRMMQKSKPEQP